MPSYDFRCVVCDEVFEVTRAASDRSPVSCVKCGGDVKRVFTPVGVVFKGSGFHSTDYRSQPKESSDKAAEAPSCPKADAGSSACTGCPAAG